MSRQLDEPVILIIDDQETNALLLEQILEPHGFQTLTALSGYQALEIVKETTPDLILLDLMMPEMDGFTCCRNLKKLDSIQQIPIIFLTARDGSEDIITAFKVGAADYISKPFQTGELLSRINTHLDLKNAIRKNHTQQKELSELIHILCHDLANPLHTLKLILNLSEEEGQVSPDYLNNMKLNTEHMEGIIGLVRDMMAMKEGKNHVEMSGVNLASAFETSLKILEKRLEDKQITPHIKIDPKLEVLANTTSLINSVISNILTNAIKFSERGSSIQITGKENGEQAILSIQDFGVGIPPQILEIIYKIDRATNRYGTEGEQGVGFGMPLVKKFMDSYGGRIEIFSETEDVGKLKKGTCVNLIFNKFTHHSHLGYV